MCAMSAADADAPQRLKDAEWLAWPETRAVLAAVAADGHEVRAVGGAVRDTLLHRPVHEVDMATDAEPETVMELARRAGLKAVPTGLDHGTVTLVANGRPFEVTTLRADVETYGRRAKVDFTADWAADASRRDFTINALYADADGTLFDPLGGAKDITAHRIRFIGDPEQRIREDYLRILRFFRLAAELEAPELDREGLEACTREHGGLSGLSAERVHTEMRRLLVAPAAMKSLMAMFDHGLLVAVLGSVCRLPRLERLIGIENALDRKGDAMLRLAALAVEVEEDADRLSERLRLSNSERAGLVSGALYRRVTGAMTERDAKAVLYEAGVDAYRNRVLLAWAESGAGADDKAMRDLVTLPERWTAPVFPLGGADITVLGVPAGQRLGAILKGVERHWIAGGFVEDRAALLEEAERRAASGGGAGEEDRER